MTTTEIIAAIAIGQVLGYLGGVALANHFNKPWRERAAKLKEAEGIDDIESKLIDSLLRMANSGARAVQVDKPTTNDVDGIKEYPLKNQDQWETKGHPRDNKDDVPMYSAEDLRRSLY